MPLDLTTVTIKEACQLCTLPECNESSTRCVLKRRKGQMDEKYYRANRDKVLATVKANYQKDPEKTINRVRQWRKANKDKKAEQQRRYRARKKAEQHHDVPPASTIQQNITHWEDTMSKHTPGPWTATQLFADKSAGIYAGTGNLIASIRKTDQADLTLMAAAPELLHTLETLLKTVKGYGIGLGESGVTEATNLVNRLKGE